MLAQIDKAKDIIKVKITEKVQVGKVYECENTTQLLKDDANIKSENDIILEKENEISLLKSKLAWFENKVKTLSAMEWQEYNNLRG